jgi:hypothetical protein
MQMQSFSLLELMLIIAMIVLYFLPSLIAYLRQHKNILAIFMLNLLLGWNVLGWVGSLVWSLVK